MRVTASCLTSCALIIGLFLPLGCSKDKATEPTNHAPQITSVTATPDSVGLSGQTTVYCVATDVDRDVLTYAWSYLQGSFTSGTTSASVIWQAPNTAGGYAVYVTVSDGVETASSRAIVKVVAIRGSISGRVTDVTNGNSIIGATITTQPATTSTMTDGQGHYTLSDVPPASYAVSASKEGYTEDSVEVVVTAGDTVTTDIALSVSDHAGEERDFPLGNTGQTIRMCWIPAGNFQMGRVPGEQNSESDEDPRHQVTFAHGFWLGKYEIMQAQWQAVMGSNPSRFPDDIKPVENVSWDDIQDFESALGGVFRLPSESEWEYACRTGTTTRYYWGDDPDYSQIGTYAWYYGNSNGTTHKVGTKSANAWRLCDMSGNVWEWCEDWIHVNYSGAPNNGSAWVDGGTTDGRVLRGGSYFGFNAFVYRLYRSADRAWDYPDYRGDSRCGFRVAADFQSP